MARKRILIMGAAGRDFHNFNAFFRSRRDYEVVAFTATQIPNIEGRRYPASLAGRLYPKGIPIYPESRLEELVRKLKVDQVVFSYSDVSHEHVMHLASKVIACGTDFRLMGTRHTAVRAKKVPVVTVTAVRTGCGKSQTTRKVALELQALGYRRVVVVRHPMPYGNLERQAVQRFKTLEDLARHDCTIEEREEYEPHIRRGTVVYAGVDYEKILRRAEREADVIVWDGGNNDLPFYEGTRTLDIVVVDPHRAGHEVLYHPGEANLRRADVIVINKMATAKAEDVRLVKKNIRAANPGAVVVRADSPIFVEDGRRLRRKRVLVVEDGPTLTHGGMAYGAGVIAARQYGAKTLVDPRKYAVRSIKETFKKYPHIGKLLPAMGYGKRQVLDLEKTISRTPCDVVLIGTPVDLRRLLRIDKPAMRATYKLAEIGRPTLREILRKFGFKGR